MIIQGRKTGSATPAADANAAGSSAGTAARPSKEGSSDTGGRPAKNPDQLTDKTLANKAAQG